MSGRERVKIVKRKSKRRRENVTLISASGFSQTAAVENPYRVVKRI